MIARSYSFLLRSAAAICRLITLTAGAYSVGGVAYNYRSALQTANAALTASPKAYTITTTDVAGKVTGSSAQRGDTNNNNAAAPPIASSSMTLKEDAPQGDVNNSVLAAAALLRTHATFSPTRSRNKEISRVISASSNRNESWP